MKPASMGYISIRAAAARTGRHHSTLRRWWEQGLFPKPRRLGPNSIGFLESEFEEWLASRPAVGEPRDLASDKARGGSA
jgi:predicted DNA-binding transcriptional regulator AlpA